MVLTFEPAVRSHEYGWLSKAISDGITRSKVDMAGIGPETGMPVL